jgi:class 3 adenylate cyclase/tetratricopeptide (TPR) repeat protein
MNDPSPAEVRTFLIADVRGYTRFTLERGDEAAAALATRFADLAEAAVTARAGAVIELRGDEALAVFTSARQALRAALDLQESFAQAVKQDATFSFKVGIGLDAGEAIPVKGGYRGAALNLAARLCSLAAPGEVLASEGVVHLARKIDGVAYEPRGRFPLKGFAEPVEVVRVVPEMEQAQAPAEPELAPGGQPEQALPIGGFLGSLPTGPLIGRREEVSRLLVAVDAAYDGRGQLVLLAGEPGVGKTRLAQEATLMVRDRGFLIAGGRCYEPQQTVPHYPFLDALVTAHAYAPAEIRTQVPRSWPQLGRLLPDLQVELPAGGSPQEEQQRLFRAVTGFLQAIAGEVPVALLLDDLHWVDEASLDLLQHLARHTRTDRILILGTYRDTEVTRKHPLDAALRDLIREELLERISVGRLEQGDTAALMAATFGEEHVSDDFASLVHRRTEGNPFFVQHVLRVLVERGDVYQRDGRWDRRDVAEIEVPETVRAVIAQRFSALDEETQEIAREASVLGQTFVFDHLQQIAGRPEEEVERALEDLMERGLVRELGHDVYSFDHALTQQSLYAEIGGRRRRRLHLAAAEVLEQLPERQRLQRAGEIARHFQEGDNMERALPFAVLAGDQARAAFAHEEAERQYGLALNLARQTEDEERVAEILERRGRLLNDTFKGHDAAHDFEELLALARGQGLRQRELVALLGLARAHYVTALDETSMDAASRCRSIYEEAYALARALGDKRAVVRALLGTRWLQDFWPEYHEQTLINRREALAISEEMGDEDLILESKLAIWRTLSRPQAEAMGDELERALRERSDLHRLNELYFGLMWAHWSWGNLEHAVEACDAGIRLAAEIGVPPVQYPSLKALALMGLGRYGEAWEALQQEVAGEGHPLGHAMQGLVEGMYLLDLLAYDRAVEVLEDTIERGRRVQRAWIQEDARMLIVLALARAGRVDDPMLSRMLETPLYPGDFSAQAGSTELALARGAPEDALRQIEPAIIQSREKGNDPYLSEGLEIHARIFLRLARLDEALASADEALGLAEKMHALPYAWRAQQTRGDVLQSLGRDAEATEARQAAAAIVRQIADSIPDSEIRETFLAGERVAMVLNQGV